MKDIIKVGVFMTIAMAIAAYLIIRSEDIRFFAPEGVRLEAAFDSIAGLDDKSTIRVAGVRVGRVDGIRLVDGQARVSLLLEEPVLLTVGTTAVVANLGLLGDKYIELVPGPPGAPPLSPDAVIPGEPPASIDRVINSLGDFGESLSETMGQLSGDGEGEGGGPVGRLMTNLEATSEALRELIAANRDSIELTAKNFESVSATLATELPRLSGQLQTLLTEILDVISDNRDSLQAGLSNVEELTSSFQTSVENLNQITGRIAAGEGTIGKLLSSDEAHDELVATLESVQGGVEGLSDTLGRIQKVKLELAMQTMYLDELEDSRGSFRLDLTTSSGRPYRLELVDDPRGRERTELRRITTTEADGSTSVQLVETLTTDDKYTFSALLGLPLHDDLRLWTGLIESTFGTQLDYYPAGRWWLSMEAFDFDRAANLDPHLRVTAGWQFHENLYLLGGYDDFLTDEFRSAFIGGGLRWTDDDLKYLLGSLPSF